MIKQAMDGGMGVRWALLMVALWTLTGCGPSSAVKLKTAEDAFERQDWPQAYQQGAGVASGAGRSATDRQAGAYLAGTAAYKLQSLAKAQEYLNYATRGRNKALASKAQAMLGLTYDSLGRHDLAARNLLQAAGSLQGQDQANAYFHAGKAQQKLGQWGPARATLSLAMSHSHDAAFRQQVTQQLRTVGFTLQAGAFAVQENATRLAGELADIAVAQRLGLPRVVPAAEVSGRTRYLIWIGQFSSWPAAVASRQRFEQAAGSKLGPGKTMITPLNGG